MHRFFFNKRLSIGPILLSLILCLGVFISPLCASNLYEGFTIDSSRATEMPDVDQIENALHEQIDMLESVGLSDDILAFFRTVPIEIVPSSGVFKFEPGFYSGSEKNVQVSSSLVTLGHKPVLIHEMLHAFHDQKIHLGIWNPVVIDFYNEAKQLNAYSPQSHMMSNNREFFACSGTTYLFGVTAQEPFSRQKVQSAQPQLVAYFQTLFGPNSGSYAGSLTR